MRSVEMAAPPEDVVLNMLLKTRGSTFYFISALNMTCLYRACSSSPNNAVQIEYLLKGGADPNKLQPEGSTAFHYVLEHSEVNIIQLMMKYGASLETKTEDGRTPLHSASLNKHTSVIQMLLDKGADINAGTKRGVTVLETSLYSRSPKSKEIIAYLMWKGAKYGNQVITDMTMMPLSFFTEKEHMILKRIALDDYKNTLSDKSKQEIAANISISQFHEDCKAELARLSKVKLNQGYSPVDILLIPEPTKIVELVAGCQIKEIFDKSRYPKYHVMYVAIFSKELEDLLVIENCAVFLMEIFDLNSRNHIILQSILRYLTADDLRNFSPKI